MSLSAPLSEQRMLLIKPKVRTVNLYPYMCIIALTFVPNVVYTYYLKLSPILIATLERRVVTEREKYLR
ncbi:hypothetical protein [Diadegma fenestrale ichnovirus]|nr:hypothetical protein [Diadegma fenestrale ichnovirus]